MRSALPLATERLRVGALAGMGTQELNTNFSQIIIYESFLRPFGSKRQSIIALKSARRQSGYAYCQVGLESQ